MDGTVRFFINNSHVRLYKVGSTQGDISFSEWPNTMPPRASNRRALTADVDESKTKIIEILQDQTSNGSFFAAPLSPVPKLENSLLVISL